MVSIVLILNDQDIPNDELSFRRVYWEILLQP